MIVISGGQLGADQAGLLAAKTCGIPTGGWLPKDCMTLDGIDRSLLDTYGMLEHHGGYRDRTWENVNYSSATIRFATSFSTAGEVCTLRAIRAMKKKHFDVKARIIDSRITIDPTWHELIAAWLLNVSKLPLPTVLKTDSFILNVAGNGSVKGLDDKVADILINVFRDARLAPLLTPPTCSWKDAVLAWMASFT
jgi:hypothetical protein